MIGERCFQESGLEEVTIPAGVTEIPVGAFYHCANLKLVQFDKNCKVENIRVCAFAGSGLENFVAPESLRQIGDVAFCNCKQLSNVVLNDGL